MLMVREGRMDDMSSLAGLRATWAAEQDLGGVEDPDFEEAFRDWAESNPRKVFVAEQDGVLIGMLNLMVFQRMPKPRKEASCWVYLGNVYVLPQHRNVGTGRRLVEAAIEFSQNIGAARMVLAPSADSRSFYVRLGFQPAQELVIRKF